MQPTLRQTPPQYFDSTTATFSPSWEARIAATYPPGPAPSTTTSKSAMPPAYRPVAALRAGGRGSGADDGQGDRARVEAVSVGPGADGGDDAAHRADDDGAEDGEHPVGGEPRHRQGCRDRAGEPGDEGRDGERGAPAAQGSRLDDTDDQRRGRGRPAGSSPRRAGGRAAHRLRSTGRAPTAAPTRGLPCPAARRAPGRPAAATTTAPTSEPIRPSRPSRSPLRRVWHRAGAGSRTSTPRRAASSRNLGAAASAAVSAVSGGRSGGRRRGSPPRRHRRRRGPGPPRAPAGSSSPPSRRGPRRGGPTPAP